jgi:hypothetical protein
MTNFNRVAFINYFLSNGFSFEVASEEATKAQRLHQADEAAFKAKVAAQATAKVAQVGDVLLWDAMDAAGCEMA